MYIAYHDREWGVPERNDTRLFEFLILEGAQAGLSWITILKRREAYRKAYCQWDAEAVARFGKRDVAYLLSSGSGVIRNRLKVESSISNARAFLQVQEAHGSFSRYAWQFAEEAVGAGPVKQEDVPAETEASRAFSRDLKSKGFRFVGPVIMYAFMQACGLVNDHYEGCFRRREIQHSQSE